MARRDCSALGVVAGGQEAGRSRRGGKGAETARQVTRNTKGMAVGTRDQLRLEAVTVTRRRLHLNTGYGKDLVFSWVG